MFALVGVAQRSPRAMYALGRRSLARMVHDREYATEEVMRGYVDPLLLPGTVAAVRRMTEATREEPGADLSAISAPTLVLSGASDAVLPPDKGVELAGAIRGARHLVIPETGHLLAEERPDAFLEEVLAFLHEPVTA